MKLYVVLKNFRDKEDNRHLYKKDDFYPHRVKKEVSEERAAELVEKGFIALHLEVSETENVTFENVSDVEGYPKHIGGGYYELSNGDKVKGKEEAIASEQALKSGE